MVVVVVGEGEEEEGGEVERSTIPTWLARMDTMISTGCRVSGGGGAGEWEGGAEEPAVIFFCLSAYDYSRYQGYMRDYPGGYSGWPGYEGHVQGTSQAYPAYKYP